MRYVVKVKLMACNSNYWVKGFIEGHYPCLTKDAMIAQRYETLPSAQDAVEEIERFYKTISVSIDPSPKAFS